MGRSTFWPGISSVDCGIKAAVLGEIDEYDATPISGEVRRSCRHSEADLVRVVDAGDRQPAPLSRPGKLHLDRVCQPSALIGPARVEDAQVREPLPRARQWCDPAHADGHRHLQRGRDVEPPTKPVRGDGDEQHGAAAERRAADEPRRPTVSTMRRFSPPVSAAAGSITPLEDTMGCSSGGSCADCCNVTICSVTCDRLRDRVVRARVAVLPTADRFAA